MDNRGLTIQQMRLFAQVVQQGSISRAASAQGLPQSAVSRAIARIETALGQTLLTRSRSGVSLTAAGEAFLENATQAVHYHDKAFADVAGLDGQLTGEVRVVAPESVSGILFAPLIKHFRQAHPGAAVRTFAAQSTSIPALLDTVSADIGIVADTHAPPRGPLEPICREELYLIGPAGASELAEEEITLSRVAGLPLLLNALPGGFRTVIDAGFAKQGLTPQVHIEIDANAPLLDLLLEGEGFSILPYSLIAKRLHREGFAASRIRDPSLARRLSLAVARGRPVTPLVREAARQIRLLMGVLSDQARWLMSK